jgi:hypothetical protein
MVTYYLIFAFSEIIHFTALVKDVKIQVNSTVIYQLLFVKNATATQHLAIL